MKIEIEIRDDLIEDTQEWIERMLQMEIAYFYDKPRHHVLLFWKSVLEKLK